MLFEPVTSTCGELNADLATAFSLLLYEVMLTNGIKESLISGTCAQSSLTARPSLRNVALADLWEQRTPMDLALFRLEDALLLDNSIVCD